jgi:pantoate--beta-alanine ligase
MAACAGLFTSFVVWLLRWSNSSLFKKNTSKSDFCKEASRKNIFLTKDYVVVNVSSRLDPKGLGRKEHPKGMSSLSSYNGGLFLMESMKVVESIKEMQSLSESLRLSGKILSFVPTMGYFHEGHLSLMKEARKTADHVVVSIYVNPTQFGPKEDFSKYPRDFERDAKMAQSVGVDVIFFPSNSEMYPEGYQTFVDVEKVTQNLCGASRPGHFRGVTTVCCKLFNIVKPHSAIFGKKDFQQLAAIKRMVADLNLDLEIVGMPTYREPDGLAMSSRNVYLSKEERVSALSLVESLRLAQRLYAGGERNADMMIQQAEKLIKSKEFTAIDYVKICDAATLEDVREIKGEVVMALAVKVGKTRLIDNSVLGEELKA